MESIVSVLLPVLLVAAFIVERIFPGKALPKVRFWLPKGIFFIFLSLVANAAFPALVARMLGSWSPLHLSRLALVPAAILGALVSDLVQYWIHRTMHRVPALWRWTHQMHHSAERMDMAGIAYAHPFEILLMFGPTSLATAMLGLSPAAAALAGLLGMIGGLSQHTNIATPRWLGYLISRPEAHAVHHTRGVHAYNYAVFPVWDILFRTFRNPPRGVFPTSYGFWDGASARIGAMLIGRDIGEPDAIAAK